MTDTMKITMYEMVRMIWKEKEKKDKRQIIGRLYKFKIGGKITIIHRILWLMSVSVKFCAALIPCLC